MRPPPAIPRALPGSRPVRSHQRPHVRSANAIAKPYRFVELPFSADVEPFVRGLARARPAWQPSQWKWHRGTYFWVLRSTAAC